MKKQQFQFSLFIAVVLMAMSPQKVWALGGSGTSSSPYTIANAADLVAFASKVNGGETGAYAKLSADITLTSAWTPIGNSSKIYTGTFDGQGHKISGLNLTATAANAGFFGYVNGATIKNFSLAGSISSNSDNVGSVVGSADGATKIYNVYSSVNITMSAAKSHIGGIAGQLLQENSKVSEIKGCAYSGTMNLGSCSDSNGGIVGYCEKNANIEIEYCFFSGSMSTSVNSPNALGGILGYADDDGDSQNFQSLKYCFVSGTLSPNSGTNVGAIAGQPKGKVANTGIIANNNYVSGVATNALGNSKTSSTSTPITISVTAGTGGSVNQTYVNPTSTTATKLHVEATPNTGYHFTKWSDNNTSANRNDVSLSDNVELTANFAAHTYGDAVWTWASDGKSASAKITCTVCGNELSGNAAITSKVKKASTCTAKGTTTYTAKVTLNGTQYTDTKDVVDIAALGHGTTGYTPTYTWGGAYSAATCTFTLKCNKCSSNVVSNQSLTTSKVSSSHKDATCTAAGNERWTATGNYSKTGDKSYSGTAQNKDYAIPALGHGQTNGYTPTYTWSNNIDVHTCSFTLKCLDCNTNVVNGKSLTGTQTAHTDATCTADGSSTYKVTGTYNVTGSKSYSEDDSKTYTIPALGHDYAAEYTIDVEPTCTEDGSKSKHCSRCSSHSDVQTIAALGHQWENGECTVCHHAAEIVHTGTSGTCTWMIYEDGLMIIKPTEGESGTLGSWEFLSEVPWYAHRNEIKSVKFYGKVIASSCFDMFYVCSNLQAIDLSGFNTANVTNMGNMFYNCSNLQSLDLSGFNTANVTNMGSMFDGCSNLQSLDLSKFNTANVTNMACMFNKCSNLHSLDLSKFNTANVTNMNYMFQNCSNLQSLDLSGFNTTNVTNMIFMFNKCSSLQSLDLSKFNTANVTNMNRMFCECSNLQSLDLSSFNTANVTNMNSMFYECSNLRSLDLSSFNTENVTNMNYMFNGCSNLQSLVIGNFDMQKATTNYTFGGCPNLNTLTLKSLPYLSISSNKETPWDSFEAIFSGEGKTVNLILDENSVIYEGNDNHLPPITNCNHYNQTTPVHVDVTCTEEGYDGKTCSYCHNDFDKVEIPALGHQWDKNLVCTVCHHAADVAHTGTSGTCTWTICEDGLMIIKPTEGESGTLGSWENNLGIPWYAHLNEIKSVKFYGEVIASSCIYMFYCCSNLQAIDLSGFNTANVTNMSSMFKDCSSLQSLDLSNFNTANVTNMNFMFQSCSGLQSLDLSGFNTANVTNMNRMFEGCSKLQSLDLSKFNTTNVTDMTFAFYGCSGLQSLDLSSFNTANVTNMAFMFEGCSKLQSLNLSKFNTANVTNMMGMFKGCSSLQSLDLSNFNTANVLDMEGMFYDCSGLQSLDLSKFNTANVTNMNSMFCECSNLQSLDLSKFNTASVTIMMGMFYGCSGLQSLVIGNFDMSNVPITEYMFSDCDNLSELTLKSLPFLKQGTFYDQFRDKTVNYNLELDDNSIVWEGDINYLPVSYEPVTASYTRSMPNEWGTIVLPFNFITDNANDYEFYTLAGATDECITLTKVDDRRWVNYGTPLFVHMKNGANNLVISNNDNTAFSNMINIGSAAYGLQLIGTYAATELEADDYFIANNKFWRAGDMTVGVKVAPFRAYLRSTAAGAKARVLNISTEDAKTTGMDVLNAITEGDAEYYDMNGRRIPQLQKGVNIVKYGNGLTKKIIIK